MKKLLTTFIAMLVLAGCVTSGVMIDLDKLSEFKKGVTTEKEVIEKLGPPTSVSSYGDIRSIAYSGVEAHATGPFSSKGRSVFVMFQFQNDKLLSVTNSQTNMKTN